MLTRYVDVGLRVGYMSVTKTRAYPVKDSVQVLTINTPNIITDGHLYQ